MFFFYCFSQMEAWCSFWVESFLNQFHWLRGKNLKFYFYTASDWPQLANSNASIYFTGIDWQRLPGQRPYRYRVISERIEKHHLAVTQWVHQGKNEKYSSPVGKFPFCHFELRHCCLVLVIYTLNYIRLFSCDYWCHY